MTMIDLAFGFLTLTIVVMAALICLSGFRLDFYRSYFRHKQYGQGKSPDAVLREQFGALWRLMR